MGTVDIPLLNLDAPLTTAVQMMIENERSAVATRDGNSVFIFKKKTILDGIVAGHTRLGDLSREWRVHVPSDAERTSLALDFDEPFRSEQGFMALLDTVRVSYAFLGERTMARLVTRHERLEEELGAAYGAGPASYECTGAFRHAIPPNTLAADGKCSLDGASVKRK